MSKPYVALAALADDVVRAHKEGQRPPLRLLRPAYTPLMEKPKVSLLSTFEVVAKQTAGVAALLLCVSVFYDFSYFAALGLTFAEVPTTVADHIRSALVWAPGTAFWVFSLSLVVAFGRLATGESLTDVPLVRPKRSWWKRIVEDWPVYAALSLGVVWAAVDHSYTAVYLAASGVWQYLSEAVIDHPTLGVPFRSRSRLRGLLQRTLWYLRSVGLRASGSLRGGVSDRKSKAMSISLRVFTSSMLTGKPPQVGP
jgi:hypothetical protein